MLDRAMLLSFRASTGRLAVMLLCAALCSGVVGCGDDEESNTQDATGNDATGDQSGSDGTSGGITLDGSDKVYRFTALELSEPDVSLRILLNAMIDANIKADQDDPLVVNVLFHLRSWDLTTSPVGLEAGGGAGQADTSGAEPVFSFKPDAAPAYVAAQYREADGLWKIQNDDPTSLMFPVIVRDTTFMLPLRDIILDACYGGTKSCTGTDESRIFGTLTGGIIVSEADGIQVEIDETTVIPLGDLLRDAKETCAATTDCPNAKVCNAESQCEREPDLTIDGQPAFSLAGRFVAERVAAAP